MWNFPIFCDCRSFHGFTLFHAQAHELLGVDNDETFAATFFAPEHHKKAKADRQPTVIQRTISRRMVTKSLSRDWDDSYSNWRAPRRMPLVLRPIRGLLCISDGRRPILQSVSSHVEARTLYPKIYTKMWKVKHWMINMTVLVLFCILHLLVTVQGKPSYFDHYWILSILGHW